MSENIETPIEKTAEEQLVDTIKSSVEEQVEGKADKAELEEVKTALEAMEIPSIEGLVDNEAMDVAIKTAVEVIEAKLDALPAAEVKEVPKMDSYIYKADEVEKAPLIIKAELTTNNTADAPVGNSPIYTDLIAGNPFRAISDVMPVTSASFKVPRMSGIVVNLNQNAGSQTEGGAVADTTVNVNHYNSLHEAATTLVDDLPGYDAIVGSAQVMAMAKKEADEFVTTLDAATITEHNFDLSDDDLGTDLGDWNSLMAALPSQYWEFATWVMSPNAWTKLRRVPQNGTGSPIAIDPTVGGFTFYGRPVMISASLDAGTAVDDNPVYFGDFRRGFLIGSRQDMAMRRILDNKIGAYSYYAEMRSVTLSKSRLHWYVLTL